MLIVHIPTVGQLSCMFDDNYGIFFIISQPGDSNEQHWFKFYGEQTSYVFCLSYILTYFLVY